MNSKLYTRRIKNSRITTVKVISPGLKRPVVVCVRRRGLKPHERARILTYAETNFGVAVPWIYGRSIVYESQLGDFIKAVCRETRRIYSWKVLNRIWNRGGSGTRLEKSWLSNESKLLPVADVMQYGLREALKRHYARLRKGAV